MLCWEAMGVRGSMGRLRGAIALKRRPLYFYVPTRAAVGDNSYDHLCLAFLLP